MLASHKFFQLVTAAVFMLSEWMSKVAVGIHIYACVCAMPILYDNVESQKAESKKKENVKLNHLLFEYIIWIHWSNICW